MQSSPQRRSRRLAGLSSGVEYSKSAHEFEATVTPIKSAGRHSGQTGSSEPKSSEDASKPLTGPQLICLTVALAGIEFVWATQMIFTVPIFQRLGLPDHVLGVSWMAGPISGMAVQITAGYLSDLTESSLGRRRPFLLGGLIFTVLSMTIFANAMSIASWMSPPALVQQVAIVIAFVSSFGDDISKNAIQGPLRALASDLCPRVCTNSSCDTGP